MILRAGLLLLMLASAAAAQDAAQMARQAAQDLSLAVARLGQAQSPAERVDALTATVEGYEDGLSALREGLRQVQARTRSISADLDVREAEISRLLGVLATIERTPKPILDLHPAGSLGTLRASMMLGDVVPALRQEASALRTEYDTLTELRILEEGAAATLEQGVAEVQAARVVLSQAVAARTDLPNPLVQDDAFIAALLGRVETLQAFADGLGAVPPDLAARVLDLPLPLPVAGTVLRAFNAPDAAGIRRPGWVIETTPGAQVTAPASGTIRYAGPLLDYANVIILEPRPGTLMVFGGLAALYVSPAEVVVAGAPLAQMGGAAPKEADFLRDVAAGGGASRRETLYVEVREAGRPVDPGPWFAVE
ncbi:MAG: peptidoglycan DD-metalloendopeptidase family protein [Pseudomonadota bacterium]